VVDAESLKNRFPRDGAGSFELEGGTGGITGMCACREFLEVYKEVVTFRIRTPESIDPDRTNPSAGFVVAMTDAVGSASLAVARILLQGCEMFGAATSDADLPTARASLRRPAYTLDDRQMCGMTSSPVGPTSSSL
jgi:hypothetical protein